MPYIGSAIQNVNTRSAVDHQQLLGSMADTTIQSGYSTFFVNYSPGNVTVSVAGVQISHANYIATNGTDVRILNSAVTINANDAVEITGFNVPTSQVLERTNVNITGGTISNVDFIGANNTQLTVGLPVVDGSGNTVINESGGTVTIANATLGSSVVFPSSIGVPVGAVMPLASVTVPTGFVICNGAEYSRTTYANLFAFLSFTDATCDTTNTSLTVTMDSTALVGVGFGVSGPGIPVGTTVANVNNGTTLTLASGKTATATASNVTLTFTRWGVGTSDSNFRVPDFRGEFLRGHDGGRGADPDAASRTGGDLVGSFQDHAVGDHTHLVPMSPGQSPNSYNSYTIGNNSYGTTYNFQSGNPYSGNRSAENRPRNLAVQYCIKF